MRTLLIAAAAWAAAAGVASAEYRPYTPPNPQTGTAWLAICDTDQKACSDALFDTIWDLGFGERRWAFCLENDTTPEAVTSAAEAWLRAHRRSAAKPFAQAATDALAATQRCRR